jgi:acetylornithine deacetylase/succinyl-diaminopimelate desuccinylase-like protein
VGKLPAGEQKTIRGRAVGLPAHSQHFQLVRDFLRIPSISSLSEHAGEVQRAAEWVATRLESVGIDNVRVMPTGGHPVVYGDWLHAPDRPTILVYGHFDVQPVDPIDLWSNPPFDPIVRDGRVYARGASDNKGNMLLPILAIEALLKAEGTLPVNLKLLFEGQEEIGSPQLPDFLAAQKETFACDLVVNADAGQFSEDEPALVVGAKGLCGLQIDVQGPEADLHSGLYGGAVQNPIHALVRLLDSMRAPDGRVTVDGFYDAVLPLSGEDKDLIAAVPYDDSEYKGQLGVDDLFGEPGYSTLERAWARPTLELNGIWGGFQGEGTKTVLPSRAHAKITCRLVADQDPAEILKLIASHVARSTPPGVKATVSPFPSQCRPYLTSPDHFGNQAAAEVLSQLYGKDPYFLRMGGTVPVLALFLELLDAHTVSFGFAMMDEKQHSPNEFFRLSNFERGSQAWAMLFHRLGDHDVGK